MRGRKIGEIGSSTRGRYIIRNIADIIPNWSDICSTADILELDEKLVRHQQNLFITQKPFM